MLREGKLEACIPGNHRKREFPLTPEFAESEMQTARLHNQLHKPDDTAHEETNYIKVQHIQFSLCLADYYENAHDWEN